LKKVTAVYRVPIKVKPEVAFAYISDLAQHGEWNDHLSVEALTPGPVQVGSEYISWGRTLYEKRRNELKVTGYQPSTYFAFMAQDPDFKDVVHEFKISPQGDGSLVERTVTVQMTPFMEFFWHWVIWPVINRPENNRSMAALKTQLENATKHV
jgi:Polyketide cyclase / dehydrase and lipid transport